MMRNGLFRAGFLFLFVFFVGCGEAPSSSEAADGVTAVPLILPTIGSIPPTFTPSSDEPTPRPTMTRPLPSPETPLVPTPIPFDEPVVTLHLRLPAIAYDRHLVGTVGSVVTLSDETSRRGQERRGQAVVLIELQQALRGVALEPLPDGCDACVQLAFSLPLEQVEQSGWLRDPVLLASLQNYFAVALGPHFPPQTIVGLRRTASPYAPAQTFALTADNQVWLWQETDGQIADPKQASETLLDTVEEVFLGRYFGEYSAPCQGVPIETLLLDPVDLDSITITIACPSYALSSDLLPLYLLLDEALGQAFETLVSTPPPGVPLTAVLQYQREDEWTLTIHIDGTTTLTDARGDQISRTLTTEQMQQLIRPLIENGVVQPGLATFEQETFPRAHLLVRGERGMYDAGWSNASTLPQLDALNDLIENRLNFLSGDEATTATPQSTDDAVPTVSPTATP